MDPFAPDAGYDSVLDNIAFDDLSWRSAEEDMFGLNSDTPVPGHDDTIPPACDQESEQHSNMPQENGAQNQVQARQLQVPSLPAEDQIKPLLNVEGFRKFEGKDVEGKNDYSRLINLLLYLSMVGKWKVRITIPKKFDLKSTFIALQVYDGNAWVNHPFFWDGVQKVGGKPCVCVEGRTIIIQAHESNTVLPFQNSSLSGKCIFRFIIWDGSGAETHLPFVALSKDNSPCKWDYDFAQMVIEQIRSLFKIEHCSPFVVTDYWNALVEAESGNDVSNAANTLEFVKKRVPATIQQELKLLREIGNAEHSTNSEQPSAPSMRVNLTSILKMSAEMFFWNNIPCSGRAKIVEGHVLASFVHMMMMSPVDLQTSNEKGVVYGWFFVDERRVDGETQKFIQASIVTHDQTIVRAIRPLPDPMDVKKGLAEEPSKQPQVTVGVTTLLELVKSGLIKSFSVLPFVSDRTKQEDEREPRTVAEEKEVQSKKKRRGPGKRTVDKSLGEVSTLKDVASIKRDKGNK